MTAVAVATGQRRPHRRLGREARRTQLLDVAAELVAEGGIGSLTMEGVAARAGVDKRLTYTHFANRDDLLLRLAQRELALHDAAIGAAIAAAGDGLEPRLRASVDGWLDWLEERGTLLAELSRVRLPDKPELEREQQARMERVEGFYAAMVREELDVPEETARRAAAILIAGAFGVLQLCIRDRSVRREAVDTFVRIAMGGLEALVDR